MRFMQSQRSATKSLPKMILFRDIDFGFAEFCSGKNGDVTYTVSFPGGIHDSCTVNFRGQIFSLL